jgi:putative DNA primase/helicase
VIRDPDINRELQAVLAMPPVNDDPYADDGDTQARATELDNARLIWREHGERIRFNVDRGDWYTWTGTHWARDVDGIVDRLVKATARGTFKRLIAANVATNTAARFAARAESAAGVSGVTKLLQTEPGISLPANRFDLADELVNVTNGTIDLRTGELRPHDRRDLLTRCLAIEFDPEAHRRVVCDRRFVSARVVRLPRRRRQRQVGFRRHHHQHPRRLLRLGCRDAADEQASRGALHRGGGPFRQAPGRRERNRKRRPASRRSGQAPDRRQDFFEFRRTHKLILVTNHKPIVTEDSEAMRRRIRLIPWAVTIEKSQRDPDLMEKLKAESPGILAWIVAGAVEFFRSGMRPPEEVLIATDGFFEDADPLADYLAERTITGPAEVFKVTRKDLRSDYAKWTSANRPTVTLTTEALYARIRKIAGVKDADWRANGKPAEGFKGIALCASAAANNGAAGGQEND